jgi:hypothetical protein
MKDKVEALLRKAEEMEQMNAELEVSNINDCVTLKANNR